MHAPSGRGQPRADFPCSPDRVLMNLIIKQSAESCTTFEIQQTKKSGQPKDSCGKQQGDTMFKFLIRQILTPIPLLLVMFTPVNVYAVPFEFSYTFEGNRIPEQTWAPGSILSGRIDGTVDPNDSDRVFINSFGRVVLSRPGLPVFEYGAIDASEFHGFDGTPFMSFSGTNFDFIACPGGFIDDTDGDGVPDHCTFGISPGGGFLMSQFATAADGTGDSEPICRSEDPDGQRRLDGCRVLDFPIVPENWSLVLLPDGDSDGVPDDDDNCPNTVIPESIPTKSLGVNRFALVDGDDIFDTTAPKGKGPGRGYTIADTTGCSCTQIVEAQGLGNGHTKFGCSIDAMDDWLDLLTP